MVSYIAPFTFLHLSLRNSKGRASLSYMEKLDRKKAKEIIRSTLLNTSLTFILLVYLFLLKKIRHLKQTCPMLPLLLLLLFLLLVRKQMTSLRRIPPFIWTGVETLIRPLQCTPSHIKPHRPKTFNMNSIEVCRVLGPLWDHYGHAYWVERESTIVALKLRV